jgi:hypothetical protein
MINKVLIILLTSGERDRVENNYITGKEGAMLRP